MWRTLGGDAARKVPRFGIFICHTADKSSGRRKAAVADRLPTLIDNNMVVLPPRPLSGQVPANWVVLWQMFKEEEWGLLKEISSAVFRVAALVREPSLKKELVSAAVELVAKNNLEDESLPSLTSVDKLGRLISLGRTVGEISQINSMVLEREINGMRQRVKELTRSPQSFIFSAFGTSVEKDRNLPGAHSAEVRKSGNAGNESPEISSRKPEIISPSGSTIASELLKNSHLADRQRQIMEYVRKFPEGCRTKDIYMNFPDVSDRTLRNDIRALVETLRLEKFGGPEGQEKIRLLPIPVSGREGEDINVNTPFVTTIDSGAF